ncbi:PEP-CTERM protein-sorting domain-containing protein [Sphingomonas laterariae]|uniref:PEP-CTERM protein-sorting domain-containing protein n=1 Tax=Edaphosphingomonas laterariae TaxID=861865 RepID=A0A239DEV5_9SPHN|nr:PEPxxWA-CTERM sorting domain-containing protein [Sphingomonas laterariae]SNS30364.1 PEP-CTERM protein-sorting domain-containing protein [Sphingomonas laterariae]
MKKLLTAVAAFAAIGLSTSASAAITFFLDDPGAVQPDENVQFNDGLPNPANPLLALTNQGTSVTFTSNELLFSEAGGQARITGDDGGLTSLTFFLTDLGKAISEVEFDLTDPNQGDHGFVTVDFYDLSDAITSTGAFQLGQGSDWVSAITSGGSLISKVVITSTLDLEDVRQIRVSTADRPISEPPPVPEPATWAMMIAGFGLVGGSMRWRHRSYRLA